MEYLRIKIKPTSSFATEPVSDTIFGQVCYTLALMNEDVDEMLADYETDPFLVVSDFFPMGYALKPLLPIEPDEKLNIENLANRKKNKNRNRLLLEDIIKSGKILDEYFTEPKWKVVMDDATHVNINRFTGTTGKGAFAPFDLVNYYYSSSTNGVDFTFDLYLYVREQYKSRVIKALENIGKMGYGGKTTIGKGRFSIEGVKNIENIKIDTADKNCLFTLGCCTIYGLNNIAGEVYYTPNTKFGKHGVVTADGVPFKSPYVTAKQGMVLLDIKDVSIFDKPFIGNSVTGISYKNNTVAQGYSLYIPFMR